MSDAAAAGAPCERLSERGWRRVVAALVTFDLATRLALAMRPLATTDACTMPDDAYLSLTIARSIARGLGPFYETGFTNGFQPLYVFLCAPFYWIWPDNLIAPVYAALALLAVCDALALLALVTLGGRLGLGRPARLLIAVAWICGWRILYMTLNGLETMLSMALIAATWLAFYQWFGARAEAARPRHALGLGILLGLACFARIDNGVLAAVAGIAMLARARRWRLGPRPTLMLALALGAGFLLAYGSWLAYSWQFTGTIYPVSGKATRYKELSFFDTHIPWANFYATLYRVAWRVTGLNAGIILTAAAGLFVAHAALTPKAGARPLLARVAPLAPVLAHGAALALTYRLVTFGSWYFHRYLFPLVIPALLLMGTMADVLVKGADRPRLRIWLFRAAMVGVVAANLAHPDLRDLLLAREKKSVGYMPVGLWAAERFAPGTVIGSAQTGALGYFAPDLTVVNLDGVVNQEAYEALGRLELGEYLQAQGVQYIVDWPFNIGFITRRMGEHSPLEAVEAPPHPGITTWDYIWLLYNLRPKT